MLSSIWADYPLSRDRQELFHFFSIYFLTLASGPRRGRSMKAQPNASEATSVHEPGPFSFQLSLLQ
jgi:hypothetical protein